MRLVSLNILDLNFLFTEQRLRCFLFLIKKIDGKGEICLQILVVNDQDNKVLNCQSLISVFSFWDDKSLK